MILLYNSHTHSKRSNKLRRLSFCAFIYFMISSFISYVMIRLSYDVEDNYTIFDFTEIQNMAYEDYRQV